MNEINVNYVTTLPKLGNAPKVEFLGNDYKQYKVYFYEKKPTTQEYVFYCSGVSETNKTFIGPSKQWYTDWFIKVTDLNDELVFSDKFSIKNKVIYIKLDAFALGDSIAWIPYIEYFRLVNECTVICSTFHNEIFISSYPNIIFVKPNSVVENIYAQYYIGADNSDNILYAPIKSDRFPLQMVASSSLGLKWKEIKPDLTTLCKFSKRRIPSKYVTLSEFGSSNVKYWKYENGWQDIVNYLTSIGYTVVVISKEKTNLVNVIDLSGDYPLKDRIIDIYYADYHFGVSSGLSWLAWSLNTHVVMISDVTPVWHEFKSNITRISANPNLLSVDYTYDNMNVTTPDDVIGKLNEIMSFNK
jgi:autotransporter strand-loop-strand O-heptosyltransferase